MFSYFKKHLKESILAPLFKFIEATFELLVPFVVKQIINAYIIEKDLNNIILHIVVLVCLGIVGFLFCIIAQYEAAKASAYISADIRNDLMKNINMLDQETFDKYGKEKLISYVTTDINQIQTTINMLLRLLLRSPFVVVAAIVLSMINSPSLGIYSLIGIPICFAIIFAFLFKAIRLNKDTNVKLEDTLNVLKEDVNGIRFIKANNDSYAKAFNKKTDELENAKEKEGLLNAVLNPITYLFINAIIALIVIFGVKAGEESGTITASYNYMTQILWELVKFANLMILLAKGIASYKRIKAFLPSKSKNSEKEDNKDIILTNVCFKSKLKNINLLIKQGEIIGLIGPLSSGKSTLIDIITKTLEPTEGNIRSIDNFSIVRSETKLFNKSIIDNITLGRNATKEAIELSIKNSCLDYVVKTKGMKYVVGENGNNLSGGEAQRLCIARALLNKPKLLIFDEAFSSLDNITSNKIKTNIASLKTTVIISSERYHDLSICSKIIVLANGIVEAIGTHEELMKSSKTYSTLVLSQMKEGETNE